MLELALLCAVLLTPQPTEYHSISPSEALTTGGSSVTIRSSDTIGCYGTCDPPKVFFDGVESPSVTVLDPGRISAVVPPHPAEQIVRVTVVTPWHTLAIDNDFAYVRDRMPVLIPIAATERLGQSGTKWTSELWAHNDSDEEIALQPAICAGMMGLFYCNRDRWLVPPRSSRKLPRLAPGYGTGEYLYVPRDVASQVSLDLRVLDSSREHHEIAIPVIREPQRVDKLMLLNVPADSSTRKFLRVYVLGDALLHAYVYDMESDELLGAQDLELQLPTDASGPSPVALSLDTSQIFNIPEVQRASRLRVEIVAQPPSTMIWAMITATDNVTQEVTVIAPQ